MKYLMIMLLVSGFASCQPTEAPGNTSLDTGFQQTPLVTKTKPSDSLHSMDTSIMIVDSIGNINFDGMPVERKQNNVYNAVYSSWLQAYQKTDHLPLVFKLVQQGTVTMGIRDNLGEAITKAQDDLKNYIAKDKFKKKFPGLSPAEKESLQTMHPVLFRKPF